jgi:protein-tyrosine phosphatase
VVIHNILVVCVANLCRSPIAQGLLIQRLPDRNIWSAGLNAVPGELADRRTVAAAAIHGLDLSAHRTQSVAGWMCEAAELILVMEQSHRSELERRYPLVRGKVFLIGAAEQVDIADPFRLPEEAFATTYADIERGVSHWVARIRQLD